MHRQTQEAAAQWLHYLSPHRIGGQSRLQEQDRTAFQQDYDRIVFSSSFRRLKDKTQVFPLAETDYVRTRLTHSLEASCVGRSLGTRVGRVIVERYGLNELHASDFGAVVAAACLAHDIGNPPFGHSGENAIRDWFSSHPGPEDEKLTAAQHNDLLKYEGNAQGFRILTRLQIPSNYGGLQLTAAVLAAFTKYPCSSDTPTTTRSTKKFGYFQADSALFHEVATRSGMIRRAAISGSGAWHRHPLAFLVEAADDICYRIVDVEDGARMGCISYSEAEELLIDLVHAGDKNRLASLNAKERIEFLRAKSIGRLVEEMAEVFLAHEPALRNGELDQELLAHTSHHSALERIQTLSYDRIYVARQAMEIESAGYEVLAGLFDLFCGAVDRTALKCPIGRDRSILQLLPRQFLAADGLPDPDPYLRRLQIADFIAGATDSYAVSTYRKLKGIVLPGQSG